MEDEVDEPFDVETFNPFKKVMVEGGVIPAKVKVVEEETGEQDVCCIRRVRGPSKKDSLTKLPETADQTVDVNKHSSSLELETGQVNRSPPSFIQWIGIKSSGEPSVNLLIVKTSQLSTGFTIDVY